MDFNAISLIAVCLQTMITVVVCGALAMVSHPFAIKQCVIQTSKV